MNYCVENGQKLTSRDMCACHRVFGNTDNLKLLGQTDVKKRLPLEGQFSWALR